MKKCSAIFIASLALILCILLLCPVSAQTGFALSMPIEHVNYSIVSVDGVLWAKIDGTYPIHVNGDVPMELPMVYPTPPQTTNISITVDDKPLAYSNYTEVYPSALHHTAMGDWAMVAATISPVTPGFTLKIHYEHPLSQINGSNLFLYDLNISPYLSPENNNSTAYFTIRLEANVTDVKAFTTETDTKWNPINCTTTKDGAVDVVSVEMHSEYGKPLLGDLVVEFSSPDDVPEYPFLVLVVVLGVIPWVLVYLKSKTRLRAVGDF